MYTIFALASARGKAGVAVVRISGPSAFVALNSLCGVVPELRRASLRTLRGEDGQKLDEALVLAFPHNHSFTGEDVAELQLHGSIATVSAVLDALGKLDDLRLAEPGEFTRRALMNGRLDLAQVEGLADLIDAETEAQRRQALRVLSGAVGDQAEKWRAWLIRAIALIEATIDFADEDVPVDVTPEVTELVERVVSDLKTQVTGVGAAERIRDGFEVAIIGPPNIGKSTLLNALAGREAAITSEIAGTTRDVIEVRMDLGGLAVTLLDTAGLRDSDDALESLGIKRAIDRAQTADLRIFLINSKSDLGELPPLDGDIVVYGKADQRNENQFSVSGKTGTGIPQLIDIIMEKLLDKVANAGIMTRQRHKGAIESALAFLESAVLEIQEGADRSEFIAEELRSAMRALDSLVGRVDVEQVLDEIFASFCLGK